MPVGSIAAARRRNNLIVVTGAPQLAATGSLTSSTNTMPASFNVAYAAGLQVNDVAIIYVYGCGALSALTINTPAGWGQIAQFQPGGVGNFAMAVFWKRLDGTESGSVTVTASGGTGTQTGNCVQSRMTTWRGCITSGSPFEAASSVTQATSGSVAGASTRTVAGPDRTLVHCYSFVDGAPTFTQGGEYTKAWEGGNRTATQTYRLLTDPRDVAETGSISASARWGSIQFSLVPQTTVSSSTPYANDNFRNYVKLLCGFNGTNGSTTFTDESPSPRTLTANGNAQISTAQLKYGTASGLFDGTGDFVTAPDSADWDFGSGPLTVELFARLTTKTNSQAFVGQWDNVGTTANDAWFFYITGGNLTFRVTKNASTFDVAFAWVPTVSTWYHIAVDRDIAGTSRLYIDGAKVASTTVQNVTVNNSTNLLSVGRIGTGATFASFDYQGNQDELRITNGIARYNSDAGFTVPAGAYPRA